MSNNVLEMHTEMRFHALRAGIKETRYDKIIEKLEERNDSYYVEMFKQMVAVYEREFKEVLAVYNQMHITPEMWETYDLLGINDLVECQMLRAAYKKFAAAIRSIKVPVREKNVRRKVKS